MDVRVEAKDYMAAQSIGMKLFAFCLGLSSKALPATVLLIHGANMLPRHID